MSAAQAGRSRTARMQFGRSIAAAGLATVLTGGALAAGSFVTSALANHGSDPATIQTNLTTCVQVAALYPEHGPYEPVVEDVQQPAPRQYGHGPVNVTVVEEEGESRFLDLSAEAGFEVTAVIVKGGQGSNIYFDTLTGLHAPINPNNDKPFEISHYTICGQQGGATAPPTKPPYPKKTKNGEPPKNGNGYPTKPPETEPPEESIELTVLEPVCNKDLPYLEYAIEPAGFEPTDIQMTWVNPDGDDIVYEGLPLSGRVLWAGAVVDEQGNPLDWPGWTQLEDGTWVEGDEFDWVRPGVDVRFEVNPEMTVSVEYPPSSPDCDANPPQPPGDQPSLPKTGAPNGLLAGLGALLLVGGAALAVFGRRFARGATKNG